MSGGGGFIFNDSARNGSFSSQQTPEKVVRTGKRAENIIPIMIQEAVEAAEEGFCIEGCEVGMVQIIGEVTNRVDKASIIQLTIRDKTGSILVEQFKESQDESIDGLEGSVVRVTGSVRTRAGKNHILGYKLSPVSGTTELQAHSVQVIYSHLKLRQIHNKVNGIENLSISTGSTTASTESLGKASYDHVYNVIKLNKDEEGTHRDEIYKQVRNKISRQDFEQALDWLSSEGHIYSHLQGYRRRLNSERTIPCPFPYPPHYKKINIFSQTPKYSAVCPRSLDSFYIVRCYI